MCPVSLDRLLNYEIVLFSNTCFLSWGKMFVMCSRSSSSSLLLSCTFHCQFNLVTSSICFGSRANRTSLLDAHITPWSASKSEIKQTDWLTAIWLGHLHCSSTDIAAKLRYSFSFYWNHKGGPWQETARKQTERRTESLAGRKKSWRVAVGEKN